MGPLAASLVSTHHLPLLLRVVTTKNASRRCQCFLEGKIALLRNTGLEFKVLSQPETAPGTLLVVKRLHVEGVNKQPSLVVCNDPHYTQLPRIWN